MSGQSPGPQLSTAAGPDADETDRFIQQIYVLALRRPAGPDDLAYWAPPLREGRLSATQFLHHITASPEAAEMAQRGVAQAPPPAGNPEEVEALVVLVYQWALRRIPSVEDRQFWSDLILRGELSAGRFAESLAGSEEASALTRSDAFLPEMSNGRFIQYAYDRILGRAPMASEVTYWDHRLSRDGLDRGAMVTGFFQQRARRDLATADQLPLIDPNMAHVMGTDEQIRIDEWLARAARLEGQVPAVQPRLYPALALPGETGTLVSVITSLYRGGAYIGRFLESMTTQTIFRSCELIIIDADSPENEFAVIASYLERFPNIVYKRAATRIGIYEAWNLGAQMARGRYLTNANLDDVRRHDSFERQAEVLEKFSFVDVVYQDFFYSFDGQASFARSAAAGVRSNVPVVTPYNLAWSNSPHNAPMWRRALHDEIGWFDTRYRSAGDYDFWLRCAAVGKTFYKINDPHVVYYVNPAGISTRPDTRGVAEAEQIMREHGAKLMSEHLLETDEAFLARIASVLPEPLDLPEAERAAPAWRYNAAQRALRRLSAASRHSA